jgi:tetratricopeptide (TPR) repeat protein
MRGDIARGATLLLLLVGAAGVAHAKAEDADKAEARKHFQRGMARYNLTEYREAAIEFQAAYRLHPDPVFLYNLAQSYRLSSQPEEALRFYKTYLRADPKASNRREVESRIQELERQIATAPPPKMEPVPPPKAGPPPNLTPPPATAEPAPGAGVATSKPAPARPPAYQRWWLWTVVGVVVAGAAVGIGVGVSQSGYPNNTYPRVDLVP